MALKIKELEGISMDNYERYCEFSRANKDTEQEEFFEKLQEEFSVSSSTAYAIWYVPQRSGFRVEMIDELIRLDSTKEQTTYSPILGRGINWDDKNNRFLPVD